MKKTVIFAAALSSLAGCVAPIRVMKYLFIATFLAFATAAMCAENAPAVLDCKVEAVKGRPSVSWDKVPARALVVGSVLVMSVSNLTANGDTYVYDWVFRDWTPPTRYSEITISRTTGKFDYENVLGAGVGQAASGTCTPERVKF